MTITVDIRPEVPAERVPRDLLTGEESRAAKATNLMELFEPIRGLLTDEEVDTLFSRNPSTGRPVEFG